MRIDAVEFGLPLDRVTMNETVEVIDGFVRAGRAHGRTHQVATVNVDFVVNALEDDDLAAVLRSADLNLADGVPLVWLSRWLGPTLPERVAGSDLVPRLAEESVERGWHVHLFGGAGDAADRAGRRLRDHYHGARVTASPAPHIRPDGEVDKGVVEQIRQLEPDILCVALGNPKQEFFIARHRERLGCPVQIGVGGSLDLIVGERSRAPTWLQRSGGEWIYRALQEPGRLGPRYLHDLRVLGPKVVRWARSVRPHRHGQSFGVTRDGEIVVVRPAPDEASARGSWGDLDLEGVSRVEIDVRSVESIDAFSHGAIIHLGRTCRRLRLDIDVVGLDTARPSVFDDYGTMPLLG